MTTAKPKADKPTPPKAEPGYRTTSVGYVVGASLASTLAAGLVSILVAALVSGSSAALGAGIAVTMVSLFFALGATVLAGVTKLAPAASLLVALLTYTLNVAVVGLVFLSLRRSDVLAGPVDPRWLGGTVIACTMVWMTAQIVFSMRARQLAYDLPSRPEEASVR